jgi:phosphatidate cytidylyltransferase
MLVKRTISAVVIIIFCALMVWAGGWVFTVGLGLILASAAWEYAHMFTQGGYAPAKRPLMAAAFLIAVVAHLQDPYLALGAFGLAFMLISAFHVLTYPAHTRTAGLDLAISLGGLVFIAFPGIAIAGLRQLPDGMYWTLIVLAPAGISDIGAFLAGSAFGRIKISPQLSPKKTLEGYFGGILSAILTGWAMAALAAGSGASISAWHGALIGALVGVFCPLGDLAKSLFKRQFDLKDTGDLIPGHGGMLDRIDTALWAGMIGYHMIIALWL